MGKNDGAAAASATYRKATNSLAEKLGVEPKHTQSPSEDFEKILSELDESSSQIARRFYRLGLFRGLRKATDWVVDGTLEYKDGALIAPESLHVKVRVKMPNEEWKKKRFVFSAKKLGFE
jgi:hypothetical protein